MKKLETAPFCGNFINGEFILPRDPSGQWINKNPGNQQDEFPPVIFSYEAIEGALGTAQKAFHSWRTQGLSVRSGILKKYQTTLSRRSEEIAVLIARETGKPLWSARKEVTQMLAQVEYYLEAAPGMFKAREIVGALPHTLGVSRYKPYGVFSVIGSFVSPGVFSHRHILPALLAGNVVIFKPSEKTPYFGQMIAECMLAAGVPPGVFTLLQGDREFSRRLCAHEGLAGVLFTGSSETGLRIKQDLLHQHGKILVLEMGAKNTAIVWDDIDLEFAIRENLIGAYLDAGQSCLSTSRVVVRKSILEPFIEKLHEYAKAFKIANPLTDPFMGPLIDQGALDRYLKFIGIAAREGCELVMRGKALELSPQGYYVSPSICRVQDNSIAAARKSVYQQTEFSGPDLTVIGVDELEEAIAHVNVTPYGLAASVFSGRREIFEKCLEGVEVGRIHWNCATTYDSPRIPFVGRKKSGNFFSTGADAFSYCGGSVSSFERPEIKEFTEAPGLNCRK